MFWWLMKLVYLKSYTYPTECVGSSSLIKWKFRIEGVLRSKRWKFAVWVIRKGQVVSYNVVLLETLRNKFSIAFGNSEINELCVRAYTIRKNIVRKLRILTHSTPCFTCSVHTMSTNVTISICDSNVCPCLETQSNRTAPCGYPDREYLSFQ